MSTALAIHNDESLEQVTTAQWLERLGSARKALDDMDEVMDVKNVADLAATAVAYAQVMRSKEAANYAVELRIWAERRLGMILLREKTPSKQVAESLRVPPSTLSRWIYFAKASEHDLLSAMESVKADRDGDLRVTNVVHRLNRRKGKRVENGIYQLPEGQYVIRWREHGSTKQRKMHPETTLDMARQSLRRNQGLITNTKVRPGTPDLRNAYAMVRQALNNLDGLHTSAPPSVRALVDDAMAELHRAEDKIAAAIKENQIAPMPAD